jgi:hypothetical protein
MTMTPNPNAAMLDLSSWKMDKLAVWEFQKTEELLKMKELAPPLFCNVIVERRVTVDWIMVLLSHSCKERYPNGQSNSVVEGCWSPLA